MKNTRQFYWVSLIIYLLPVYNRSDYNHRCRNCHRELQHIDGSQVFLFADTR